MVAENELREKDRFDLEQYLMECWHTADDIDLVVNQILNDEMSVDDAANLLIGIRDLHKLRMSKTVELFEELVSSGEIA